MDDLIPEDDLKPDTSDRRSGRARKQPSSTESRFSVSRQHMMIGVGILVLVLLIFGIGSALKMPSQRSEQQGPHDINLSANNAATEAPSSSATNSAAPAPANSANNTAAQATPAAGNQPAPTVANNAQSAPQGPQDVSFPAVSPTPSQPLAQADASQQKARVDLPGDMTDALTQQQGQVDAAANNAANSASQTTLPTAPATLERHAAAKVAARQEVVESHPVAAPKPQHAVAPAAHQVAAVAPHAAPATIHAVKPAPATTAAGKAALAPATPAATVAKPAHPEASGHYTLQLSSASQSTSLNEFAKQQGLKNYQIYQTTREGKPWFVLVSGSYATSADAKNAITSLPAAVQEKKPWAKPLSQLTQ
jgi:DamX protein